MSLIKISLFFSVALILTGCATTGTQYADRIPAENSSDTERGMRYLLGRGVPQDNAKAFTYFTKGAKDDDAFAQNELAYMYAAGKGTPRDEAKAFMYYQKAANHGLATAEYNLSVMYKKGIGTPVNAGLAQKWLQKAAASGFEPAKQALKQR